MGFAKTFLILLALGNGPQLLCWIDLRSEEEKIAALINRLGTDPPCSDRTNRKLAALKGRAVPQLTAALSHLNPVTRSHAIYTLTLLREEARPAIPELRRRLQDRVPHIRGQAASLLGELGDADAETLTQLCALLGDPDRMTRWSASYGLARLGDAGLPVLLGAVADDNPRVRASGARGLGGNRTYHSASVPVLQAILLDPDPEPRLEAILSLQGIASVSGEASEAVHCVRHVLATTLDTTEARMLIDTLGAIGSAAFEAIPDLCEYLESSDADLRQCAACSLGQIVWPTSAVVPLLEQMSRDDPDEGCVNTARQALERLRNRRQE